MKSEQIEPWYKQFWPWVLICLPLSVVIASIVTVYIAVSGQSDMIVDDYYKKGKGINLELSRYQEAVNRNLAFELHVTDTAINIVSLNKSMTDPQLTLRFIHATLADKDFTVKVVKISADTYQVAIPKQFQASKWTIFLEDLAGNWRVRYVGYVEKDQQFSLNAFDLAQPQQ